MDRPWAPERTISRDAARASIETQFPDLAPARVEHLAAGWDYTVFLVNDTWVFRFPRRQIVVDLLVHENRVLPQIAGRLPLPVPVPTRIGVPSERFPWPFAGYAYLPGRPAWRMNLSDDQRLAWAGPLARFLTDLHAIGPEEARRMGAPPDTLGRLDVAARLPRVQQRLDAAVDAGLIPDARRWDRVIDATPAGGPPAALCLVHGDLHGDNLLADEAGRPAGVIDWIDVHLGDPVVDLGLASALLPPGGLEIFGEHYQGPPAGEEAWGLARFVALSFATGMLMAAHDTGDVALVREALRTLDNVGE